MISRHFQWGYLCVFLLVMCFYQGECREYLEQIKPILKARCYACHGALKQKAGLRLDTADFIKSGSKSGAVIDLSKPEESELLKRVLTTDVDDRMPPEGEAVGSDFVLALTKWIQSGASSPKFEEPEPDPQNHWAFLPIPEVEISWHAMKGEANPIDAILSEYHDANELTPAGFAEDRQLVRRAYYDLIGLPPLDSDYAWFEGQPESRRWEQLIDKLLASPQHGERWGRHWMDVWRYTDWYGLGAQLRFSQKHIWHWRDWIVESLNADVGYDEMIRQMLAADEIYPNDQNKLRATGYLARNYYLFNRTTWLDKTIEHVGKGVLGLTLNCAKCHDHKYDPISQMSYYQFRAIFEPHQIRLDPVPGFTSLEVNAIPRAFDAHPDEPTWIHVRGNENDVDKSKNIEPALFDIKGLEGVFRPQQIRLPQEAHKPHLREYVISDLIAQIKAKRTKAESELKAIPESENSDKQLKGELKARIHWYDCESEFIKMRWLADNSLAQEIEKNSSDIAVLNAKKAFRKYSLARLKWEIENIKLSLSQNSKGNEAQKFQKQLDEKTKQLIKLKSTEQLEKYPRLISSRKALESPAEKSESQNAPFPSSSTGRRKAFAKWAVHPNNPLTARVAVNQVWMRHFGKPLVSSVSDFGRRSPRPKLIRLLDYLSHDLIKNDWKFKRLHKLILTSKAWRRTSQISELEQAENAIDEENQFFWHKPSIRVESQIIRDAILHLAGELDLTMGGPSLNSNPENGPFRRSIYFKHSRDDQNQFLVQFDDADIEACYRREESILPQQALALVNSSLALSMAPKIAKKLGETSSGNADEEFVNAAFSIILGRSPSPREVEVSLDLIKAVSSERQKAILVHALINHHEFISIK